MALQIMVYAHAIAGSSKAARFLSPGNPQKAPQIAVSIMETKLETYLRFNATYPGFGGFIPWMTTSSQNIEPTWDWTLIHMNSELLWAVYGCISALEKSCKASHRRLAAEWQKWLDYAKTTVDKVFYQGDGHVCAVTKIGDQKLPVNDPRQSYMCESPAYLDDPYEGELFTYFIEFFSGLSQDEKKKLWTAKRAKLVSVEYNMGGVGPITVEQGHEPWKILELPYFDIDIIRRLHQNAERVRTCNSIVTRAPGLFASVNNSTDPTMDEITGYISPAGIVSVASQKEQEHDVITPYAAWPTIMVDKSVGLAWWWNMLQGKKMQNPYGSTESTRVDGKLVSALATWDSKITTVVSLLGGVGDLVRRKMKIDGIYHDFISIASREYSRVFQDLKGEDVELCLPKQRVPAAGLEDFSLSWHSAVKGTVPLRRLSTTRSLRIMETTGLTENQLMVREAVSQICAEFPNTYWQEKDQTEQDPHEFHAAMAKAGWLGIALPESLGGAGLGISEATMMMQTIAESGAGMAGAQAIHANVYATQPLAKFGSRAQLDETIPNIISGKWRVCFGVTEPNAGLDTLRLSTRATRSDDGGHYSITGQKIWITCAQVASRMMLLARTTPRDEAKKPSEALSLFCIPLVDNKAADDGLSLRKIRKMGGRAVDANEVFFQDYKVPASSLIGQEGKGFQMILHGMNAERCLLAGEALGLGYAAVAKAAEYASERVVFERPIGMNQGVAHPLADAYMRLEAAKLATYHAARLYDEASKADNGSIKQDAVGVAANSAKYLAAEAAFTACERAILAHGGMGYAQEYHVERWFRECLVPRIAPVSREMILNYISEKVLRLPRSY
ncbi:hypothetical protein ARSEF4850_007199 [Beauveria asiatica]